MITGNLNLDCVRFYDLFTCEKFTQKVHKEKCFIIQQIVSETYFNCGLQTLQTKCRTKLVNLSISQVICYALMGTGVGKYRKRGLSDLTWSLWKFVKKLSIIPSKRL